MEIKGHLGNVISGNFCEKKATSEDFSEGNKRCVSISHDLGSCSAAFGKCNCAIHGAIAARAESAQMLNYNDRQVG